MLRWKNVKEQELYGMNVKMYADPFVPSETIISAYKGLELDHYAYKYLGSELYMYKIMDTNFTQYIEERGDTSRLKDVLIPTGVSSTKTIL